MDLNNKNGLIGGNMTIQNNYNIEIENTLNTDLIIKNEVISLKKYCKVANQETKQVNVGLSGNVEFYKSIGYTE